MDGGPAVLAVVLETAYRAAVEVCVLVFQLTPLLTSPYVIWKKREDTALMKLLVDVKETLPAPVQAGAITSS